MCNGKEWKIMMINLIKNFTAINSKLHTYANLFGSSIAIYSTEFKLG